MSTATSENQCTGCGATVTVQFGLLRDSFASPYCVGTVKFHVIDRTALPPVAIKPDHGSALDEKNVCPTCFREYGEDEIKFCTADDCPSHPDYRVAIKPEAALTPLNKLAAEKICARVYKFDPIRTEHIEKIIADVYSPREEVFNDMLAALKAIQQVFFVNGEGIFRGKLAHQVHAAINKAEAVQA